MPALVSPSPALASHADLIRSAKAGEAYGLGGLYDLFATRMLAVAWRLTGSMTDAEDVVHDVFVGLPEALRRYEERGTVDGWLAQITARAALMRMRSAGRRRETSLRDASLVRSVERSDQVAEYGDLEREISALPDPLRVVFVLREVEGFSHDEIAALLGISTGASRVRLSRALEALRARLQPAPTRPRRIK